MKLQNSPLLTFPDSSAIVTHTALSPILNSPVHRGDFYLGGIVPICALTALIRLDEILVHRNPAKIDSDSRLCFRLLRNPLQ